MHVRLTQPKNLRFLPAAIAATALVAAVALTPEPTHALTRHSPHDTISSVTMSPTFATDGLAFAVSRGRLLRSTDGAQSWTPSVRGVDNRTNLASVAFSPADPVRLYVAGRSNAVYVSDDGGRTWRVSGAGITGQVVQVVPSPLDPDEAIGRANTGELFRTTDGGASWADVDTTDLGPVRTVAFDPSAPDRWLVGAAGALYLSADAGASFARVLADGLDGNVTAVAFSPDVADDGTVFAGTSVSGLHQSTNGGLTFEPVEGMGGRNVASIVVPDDFALRNTIWVSTRSAGVLRSTDRGATWQETNTGLTTDPQADEVGAPDFGQLASAIDEAGNVVLLLAGFAGLFRSADDGETWAEADTQSANSVAGLTVSPSFASDGVLALSTYLNGAFVSGDGGDNWLPSNAGLAGRAEWLRQDDYFARLFTIEISPDFDDDDIIFTAGRGFLHRSDDRGATWSPTVPEGILMEDQAVPDLVIPRFSPSFGDDRTVIVGSDGGKMFRSTDAGLTFSPVGEVGADVTALVLSPEFGDDGTVVAGTPQGVVASTDQGESWSPTGAMVEGLGSPPITALALSPNYGSDQTVFAGSGVGLFRSTDRGEIWSRIGEEPFGESAVIEGVAVSPAFEDDGTVLVSVRGRGLFQSTDGGTEYAAIAPELLDADVVFSIYDRSVSEPIVFSPDYENDQTVFGTAGLGVFRSTDGGAAWTTLEVPVATHELDEEAAPFPLLTLPAFGDPEGAVRTGAADQFTPPAPVEPASSEPSRTTLLVGGGAIAIGVIGLLLLGLRRRRR